MFSKIFKNKQVNKQKNRMIGFMRNSKTPFKVVKLLAKASKYYNIDLVYFNASDVDTEKKVINGKLLINNKWETKEVTIPAFIDISPYCFKHKAVVDFLSKESKLSSDKLGTKDFVLEKIQDDNAFSDLIIPTSNFSDFNDLHSFLEQHEQIIIKPKNGLRGHHIYLLSINENDYKLSYKQSEEKLSYSELEDFYKRVFNGKRQFLLQRYVNSTTKTGDPFDCRIRLEKDGNGEWTVAIYLVRIGNNQKVVSNVAQGGSVSALTPFLEANFGNESENIKAYIKEIAKTLPEKIEKLFKKDLTSLGIDLGIDESGKLYLFEIETGPGFEFALGEIALVKSEYYNYILNNLTRDR